MILIFPLHFSILSFHWPPHSLNHNSNINPQLSISTDWWLKYAEYHSLLFIDFKLKGVMGHGLKACTYSHMLERLMIYSKSRKWVLYRCLLGSAYRPVWLHIAYLSVWTHIIRNTLKNRPSRTHCGSLSMLLLCNGFISSCAAWTPFREDLKLL